MSKTCPYYLANNKEEFDAAIKELGGYPKECLHEFPMIVGKEHGFGIFQAPGKDHPIEQYEDLVYELRTLPAQPQTPNPEERARHIRIFIRDYLDSTEVRQNTPSNILHNEQFKDVLEAALIAFSAHAQGVLAGQQVERRELDFGSLAQMLHDMPENRPLYKDSGSWQVRSDDMEQVLYQQDANETFHAFVLRCYTAENVYQDMFSTQQPTPER